MKKNMIVSTALCATLLMVPFTHTADKSIAASKKDTSAQTKRISTAELLANNDIKLDAKIRAAESFTTMGESDRGHVKRKEIEANRDLAMQEIQEESKKFEKAKNDYMAKASTMSDAAREKEEKRIAKMERDIKNLAAEKEEELKTEMQLATESLAQDLEKSIVQLAQNENIDIVIDKMTGRLLYVSPEFDITEKAIAEMNKIYKTELAQNAQQESAIKVADNKPTSAKPAKLNA